MECYHCGNSLMENAKACPYCGTVFPLPETETVEAVPLSVPSFTECAPIGMKKRNKWKALALCFFFGGLGAHRFYEGKILSALLWMFTLGLLGLGTLIDLIILLCKPNPYYV